MRQLVTLVCILLSVACANHDLRPSAFDCAKSDLSIQLVQSTASSACGVADGAIEVTASGGEPPYKYSINDEVETESGMFEELLSGLYSITVTDSRGCSAILSNININALNFSFTASVVNDTDCTTGNGSVTITVEDGQPTFQYSFNDGPFSDEASFQNLKTGTYRVLLKDGNDCSATLNVTIPKGETNTSWANDIQPLVTTHCALTGCHNGKSRPDLRIYEKAYFYARQMKTLTADGSMPFEGKLTQSQIDLIACWVDEGAKNN